MIKKKHHQTLENFLILDRVIPNQLEWGLLKTLDMISDGEVAIFRRL